MLRCFHYSVGSVHDLRRNRALVVYQYCKCHKRWLAFAENFWKNLQEIPGKTWTVIFYTNLKVGTIGTSKNGNDTFVRDF